MWLLRLFIRLLQPKNRCAFCFRPTTRVYGRGWICDRCALEEDHGIDEE
jgi:predicted amidophosphoribosyltransferase